MEPRRPQVESEEPSSGGPTTGLLILGVGAAEVAIIFALIALDSPVSGFARKAAETWPGRFILASIGMAVIVVMMIILLTIVERRQARNKSPADTPH